MLVIPDQGTNPDIRFKGIFQELCGCDIGVGGEEAMKLCEVMGSRNRSRVTGHTDVSHIM